jgi:hypothetical protein
MMMGMRRGCIERERLWHRSMIKWVTEMAGPYCLQEEACDVQTHGNVIV